MVACAGRARHFIAVVVGLATVVERPVARRNRAGHSNGKHKGLKEHEGRFGVQEKFTCLNLVRCNCNATEHLCLRPQFATSNRARPRRPFSAGLSVAGGSRRLIVRRREADAAPFRGGWRRHELPDGLENDLELFIVFAQLLLQFSQLGGQVLMRGQCAIRSTAWRRLVR